ncbi:MAG: DUF2163 domain-containing protein [Paracoccaceae bacterium]|nr:MAG: DUF2163 domain-containing protein [Paracoccaceae bacterium]
MSAILEHLAGGTTTVCRAWRLVRTDGVVLGFTDHDDDLAFDGVTFRAGTGLSARVLVQTTGLSVDNTEAEGALSAAGVTEADLLAGRYDGAEVTAWRVNWADPAARMVLFRGHIGEVVRSGGAFQAELRGLTEGLNRPQGRAIQRQCSAVLGDGQCRFDLAQPGYSVEAPIGAVEDARLFRFHGLSGFDDRWFERGRLRVLSGDAAGLLGVVKNDRIGGIGRSVELWQGLAAAVAPGDLVRIEAGCDKRPETCRLKFGNFLNFRGFPHVPGEDWLTSYPARAGQTGGGSLLR